MRHHYQLNEAGDPDNVQQNLTWLREANMPLPVKYVIVFILASTWKWAYYAPNTFKILKMAELKKEQKNVDVAPMTIAGLISGPRPDWLSLSEFIIRVAGPYVAHNIVLMLPWLYFGYYQVIIHFVLADWLSNLHTFVNIVPNHAGSDMYVYKTTVRPNTSEWFMRQTISSANYECGNNVIDFAQGWLNYQIEHHLFPKMSMLSYQRMQPEVKAICQKYGIPYVQENVFIRLKKTVDIMIGVSSFIDYQGNEFPICKSIVPQ
jgi:fatty acid desaturase